MVELTLDPDDPFENAVIDLVRFHRIGKKELRDCLKGEHECQEDPVG